MPTRFVVAGDFNFDSEGECIERAVELVKAGNNLRDYVLKSANEDATSTNLIGGKPYDHVNVMRGAATWVARRVQG